MNDEPHALHSVHRDGDPPRLVVVHGAMDRSVSFGRVVRELPGRSVVTYDRRGYASSTSVGVGGLDEHVGDLVELIGREPSFVLGHSIGGVIALVAAANGVAPILGVVAYEPPTPWTEWWPATSGRVDGEVVDDGDPADEAEAFMRRMIGERMWKRLPRSTREARRAEGVALRADIGSLAGPPPFDPSSVTVPVLAIAGAEATWYHRRAVEELAALLPDAQVATLEGATHGGHLTHPRELAQVVGAFMDRGA